MGSLTVVTPVWPPHAGWLGDVAASVAEARDAAAAAVGWQLWWVVAVDGPGDVEVPAVAGAEVVRCARRGGAAAARNRALLAAADGWVVNVDADDELDAVGVAAVAGAVAREERRGGQLGWAAGALVDREAGRRYPPRRPSAFRRWRTGELVSGWTVPMPFHPGVAWMRRELLLAVGGWPGLAGVQDKLPLFGVSELADGVVVDVATHWYRRWGGQMTAQDDHRHDREHQLAFTAQVLTARRRLADPAAAEVAPTRDPGDRDDRDEPR